MQRSASTHPVRIGAAFWIQRTDLETIGRLGDIRDELARLAT